MVVEYDSDEMCVFCDEDGCDGEVVVVGDWRNCVYELKQLGWIIVENNGVFTHSCPKHRIDFN